MDQNYGFEGMDDCCIYTLDNGKKIIQSVDFFTPIVDDPYDFGRIAASNSLSDIYAMGGVPLFALNILAFPSEDLPNHVMEDILKGGVAITNEAKIPILGGHSIKDKEPKYGLVVTGEDLNGSLIKNSTAKIGDQLILTKPLGTGIITTAIKKGKASDAQLNEAIVVMTELNLKASKLMTDFKVNACTDVTGYGLLGHLLEMTRGSEVSASISFNSISFIDGSKELAYDGIVPGGTKRNYDFVKDSVNFSNSIDQTQKYLLADAQTSGGLLISVPQDKAETLQNLLNEHHCLASSIIGQVYNPAEVSIYVN